MCKVSCTYYLSTLISYNGKDDNNMPINARDTTSILKDDGVGDIQIFIQQNNVI